MENIFTFAVLCKGITGLRQKCKVYSGQSKKFRKVFLGQVTIPTGVASTVAGIMSTCLNAETSVSA
jgi:hypothetical protein